MLKDILEQTHLTDEQLKKAEFRFDSIFRYSGKDVETGRTLKMKDAMDLPNAAFLIPRVLTTFMQEGIEPLLIGTSLLQRIQYVPGMQTIFPAIDVLTAREVGDGVSLPIFNVNVGGGQTMGVKVSRHGLSLRISERFIEASTYPWIQYWMRLAGNALARHKEEYIFTFITTLGTAVFDNSVAARTTTVAGVPTSVVEPIKGITTGRTLKGTFNGSMTMDDIFDMYAHIMAQGFIPETLLVHPMTWLMWVKDPVLREFAIQAGGGSFFAQWTGNAAAQANRFFNFAGLGRGVGQTGQFTAGALTGGQVSVPEGLPQTQTSAPMLPNYLGLPFRILVSPFVRFDPINRNTDVMMFNSVNLGALIVDEDPHVVSWNEPQYSIRNVGIEETYGLAILNEGQAIGTAKNVAIRPNELVLPARTVIDLAEATGTFQTVDSIVNFGTSPTPVLTVSDTMNSQ
jgi:hypothetical protein